jgi:hypothetical protein
MNGILGCRQRSTGGGLVHYAHKCSIAEISLHEETMPTNTMLSYYAKTIFVNNQLDM